MVSTNDFSELKAFDICIHAFGVPSLTTDLFGDEQIKISKFNATVVSAKTNLREALRQFLSHFNINLKDGVECVNSKYTDSFINQKFAFDESGNLKFGVPISFIVSKYDVNITIKPTTVLLVDWSTKNNSIHFPYFPSTYQAGKFAIFTGDTKKPIDSKMIESIVEINGNGELFMFEFQKGDFALSNFSMHCVLDQFSLMEVFNQTKMIDYVKYNLENCICTNEQFGELVEQLIDYQVGRLNDNNEHSLVMSAKTCLVSIVDNVVGIDLSVEIISVD